MKQLINIFCAIVFFTGNLFGQAETILYGSHLAQAGNANPALLNEHRITLMLPSLYNNTFFTGPTTADALADVNGQTVFDSQGFLQALDEENLFRQEFSLNTLGAALSLGGLQLSLNHSFHLQAQAVYPKQMAELALLGNGQFVGDTLRLNHDLQLFSYSEFAFGGATKLGPIQVGARLKWLNGIGAVSTESGELSLYTDPGVYDITFSSNYRLNSSSIASLSLADSLQFNFSTNNLDFNRIITRNQGIAFDLGAILHLGNFKASVAAINIGAINWSENTNNYSSQTNVTYSGLDLTGLLTSDSLDFPATLDTLKSLIQLNETQEDFSTTLPSTYRLGLIYKFTDELEAGVLLAMQQFKSQSYKTLTLYGTFAPIKWIHLHASYSIVNDTYTNIGLGASLQLGPAQVYAMTDNVMALLNPQNSRHFQGRIGLNFALSRKK